MDEDTRNRLMYGLLQASQLVPKLEGMLRRLRAISMLLMMRRDNTQSKIIHAVHSFQDQLTAFETTSLQQMEKMFTKKSEYLDMYKESVTGDIESLRHLSSEVESLLRFSPDPHSNNLEKHAKRLIEVFRMVLENNTVDIDVDDDIDCLDFVPGDEILSIGTVVSSYQEDCPLVADFSSPNTDDEKRRQKTKAEQRMTPDTNKMAAGTEDETGARRNSSDSGLGLHLDQMTQCDFSVKDFPVRTEGFTQTETFPVPIDVPYMDSSLDPKKDFPVRTESFTQTETFPVPIDLPYIKRSRLCQTRVVGGVCTCRSASNTCKSSIKLTPTSQPLRYLRSQLSSGGMVMSDKTGKDAHEATMLGVNTTEKMDNIKASTKPEWLPSRKFKLAGKKLLNLTKFDELWESSDEQEKPEAKTDLTYSAVVKCDQPETKEDAKSVGTDVFPESTLSSTVNQVQPQQVQYVSLEDRQRWKKSLDDMLMNVPQPSFKLCDVLAHLRGPQAELLPNNSTLETTKGISEITEEGVQDWEAEVGTKSVQVGNKQVVIGHGDTDGTEKALDVVPPLPLASRASTVGDESTRPLASTFKLQKSWRLLSAVVDSSAKEPRTCKEASQPVPRGTSTKPDQRPVIGETPKSASPMLTPKTLPNSEPVLSRPLASVPRLECESQWGPPLVQADQQNDNCSASTVSDTSSWPNTGKLQESCSRPDADKSSNRAQSPLSDSERRPVEIPPKSQAVVPLETPTKFDRTSIDGERPRSASPVVTSKEASPHFEPSWRKSRWGLPLLPAHSIAEFVNKNNRSTIPATLEARLGQSGRGAGSCLHFPIGVTSDADGNILVTDTGNHLVKVFDKDGHFKYTIGDRLVPTFSRPSAIVVNRKGEIFVKDDVCIYKFTPNGKFICRLGAKQFNMPYGLALTSKGDLVTLDLCPGHAKVFIISPCGSYGNSFPYEPLVNCSYDSKCRFLTVYNDLLYVSDLGCNCVYITNLYGQFHQTFGHYGRRDGQFSQAAGITVDPDGHIIVADSKNERIQIFRPNGSFLGVLALNEPVVRPSDIHLTANGRLVVVNFTSHEVKVYKLFGN